MADLADALVAWLKADAAVFSIVGERIHGNKIPQGSTYPLIRYMWVGGLRDITHDGASGYVEPRIQVECLADDYTQAKDLANAVRKSLNGKSFTSAGVDVQAVRLVSELDDNLPDRVKERVILDFEMDHIEEVV